MTNRDHKPSLTRLTHLLGISRGAFAFWPRPASEDDLKLAHCRFRGHPDKVFMKPENVHVEKIIQLRIQTGSGGVDNAAWRQHAQASRYLGLHATVLRLWRRHLRQAGRLHSLITVS